MKSCHSWQHKWTNSLELLFTDSLSPQRIPRCTGRDPGRETCCFIALLPFVHPHGAHLFVLQEVSNDGTSPGPWLFHLKLPLPPGSGQTCIISRSHAVVGSFNFPEPFSPQRAENGLVICGAEENTHEEILIQAKGSFFLFYVQIMQHNCFTVINIISGA